MTQFLIFAITVIVVAWNHIDIKKSKKNGKNYKSRIY